MASPSVFESTTEMGSYDKTKTCTDMTGELFELKMAALLFLRGLNYTIKYALATNMKSARAYDDVVFRYSKTEGIFYCIFLQLKTKKNRAMTKQMLTATSKQNDFSLLKYLKSYRNVKENYETGDVDLRKCGSFENMKFVIYSNARLDKGLNLSPVDVTDYLIDCGGNAWSLENNVELRSELKEYSKLKTILESLRHEINSKSDNNAEELITTKLNEQFNWSSKVISEKWNLLKENPVPSELDKLLQWDLIEEVTDDETCEEFLKNLIICTSQASELQLESVIKTEIERIWKVTTEELNNIYNEFIREITNWWRKENIFLSGDSQLWADIAQFHREALSRSTIARLNSFGLQFSLNSTEVLEKEINKTFTIKSKGIVDQNQNIHESSTRMLSLIVKGDQTTLTAIKALQTMSSPYCVANKNIFVSLDVLAINRASIFSMWGSRWCDTLVIECVGEMTADEMSKLSKDFQDNLSKHPDKKLILITSICFGLNTAMKQLTNQYEELEDDVKLSDFSKTSQSVFQSKCINFQGNSIPFNELTGGDEQLTTKLDAVSLGLLLNNKLELGQTLDEPFDLYIPRQVGIGQDFKYVNRCSDIPDKIVLVTGEPGIGKTTLLIHLARATKENDPSLWVVKVNLPSFSMDLNSLTLEEICDVTCKDFIQKCGTKIGTPFENALFLDYLRGNKVVLLIDAIDEVCPCYKMKILKILEHLKNSSLNAMWLTSRVVMKDNIESTLGIESRQLQHLSETDQSSLLKTFWQRRNADVQLDHLDNFTKAIVDLTSKTFKENNLLIGIPQMTMMLAEIFEPELLAYAKHQIHLPDNLNLVRLYDAFVKKKHEVFFKEKKNESTTSATIAANMSDREKHFSKFQSKHMQAALSNLSERDFQLLPMEIQEQNKTYLQKLCDEIRDGTDKTGIIDGIDCLGRLLFIHRTFYEYFLAKWIIENLNQIREFLLKITFDPSFSEVHKFLNIILSNNLPLHMCVLKQDPKLLKELLISDPKLVDTTDSGGRTCLHLVSLVWDPNHHSTYVEIATTLLKHGASVDVTDDILNWTPLQHADKTMAWTIAGLMLQYGARSSDLKHMYNYMKLEVYSKLIKYLKCPVEGNISNVLEQATKHGNKEVVCYLVNERSANINWTDIKGKTLMHLASAGGHTNLMAYLTEKKLPHSMKDESYNIPLHSAAEQGVKNAVEYLVGAGCDVDAQNSSLETPLLVAAKSKKADVEVLKILIAKGADINACAIDGLSALSFTAQSGQLAKMKYLISQGIDVNRFGKKALELAFENKNVRVVNYLQDSVKIILPIDWNEEKLLKNKIKIMYFVSLVIVFAGLLLIYFSFYWCDFMPTFKSMLDYVIESTSDQRDFTDTSQGAECGASTSFIAYLNCKQFGPLSCAQSNELSQATHNNVIQDNFCNKYLNFYKHMFIN